MADANNKRPGGRNLLITLAGILFWILLWWGGARLLNLPLIFPGPLQVGEELLSLLGSRAFWRELGQSFLRIAQGLLLGILFGVGSGLLASWWTVFRAIIEPLFAALRSVPVAAVTILFLIWVRPVHLSTVIVVVAVAPLLYASTLGGIAQRDRDLLEMAQVFRLSKGRTWRIAILPALWAQLKPNLFHAAGFAWKAGISGEIIAQPLNTLGSSMVSAKITLSVDTLFAYVVAIVLFSWGLSFLIRQSLVLLEQRRRGQSMERKQAYPSMAQPPESFRPKRRVPGEGPFAIKARELTHSYEGLPILDGFNADFPAGEPSIIMGKTGSGKTTLFRLILGLEKAESGEIRFTRQGKADSSLSPAPRFSCCFQEPRLVQWLSAKENLALSVKDQALCLGMLRAVGIQRPDQPVAEFSGGMRQKVALLRALLSESDIVLLDEPFKELDQASKGQMLELVRDWTQGKTLILSTHSPADLEYFGGKAIPIQPKNAQELG